MNNNEISFSLLIVSEFLIYKKSKWCYIFLFDYIPWLCKCILEKVWDNIICRIKMYAFNRRAKNCLITTIWWKEFMYPKYFLTSTDHVYMWKIFSVNNFFLYFSFFIWKCSLCILIFSWLVCQNCLKLFVTRLSCLFDSLFGGAVMCLSILLHVRRCL